jgi:tRNA(Arg) A34 adenosine deaminase TadA
MRNARSAKVFCSVGDDADLFTPTLRILLNTFDPKGIGAIDQNYPVLACETQAVTMMNDEDSGVKIKLEKKDSVAKPDKCFALPSDKKGAGLLGRGVNLNAGLIRVSGPNVDITKRDAPTQETNHQGVHTVHRLYMAAAYRLLLGGTDVDQNTGVAAFVVSPSGQILCWGKKNSDHRMLHAETSALIAYGARLPKGARIYSTLMPCKMCRALIEHFSTEGDFLAYYGQLDMTKAASGPIDRNKFLLLSNSSKEKPEKPIWADTDKKRPAELRTTISGKLHEEYTKAHEKDTSLGIINFVKGGKVDAHLKAGANYLEVKRKKYSDEKLASTYNHNVEQCLKHITDVLKQLNLPVPVKV